MDIIARDLAGVQPTDDGELRVVVCAADLDVAAELAGDDVVLEVADCRDGIDVAVLDLDGAIRVVRVDVDGERRLIAAAALAEAELTDADDAVFVIDHAADVRDRLVVERDGGRRQDAVERRGHQCAADLAGEGALAADRVRELVCKALHVDLVDARDHVEVPVAVDRAVEVHVDHRREDVEVLQAREAVLHEVVAVHAREQDTVVAAAVEVDVADGIRVVERARDLDRIVDVACDRLVGEGKGSDVLHARADRVDAHVDAPLARQADGAVDVPGLLAILDERELLNRHAVEAAAGVELQAVVRLLEEAAVHRRELEVHGRICDVALYRALEIAEARDIGLSDQCPHEREVDMAAVEREVETAAILHLALDAESRAVRQIEARVVYRDVLALREERGREALNGQVLVGAILQLRTAVRLQIARVRALAGDAHVAGDAAREVRELRDVGSCLLHIDVTGREVCRVREVCRREDALAARRAAKGIERNILKRDAAVLVADVRARIRERDARRRAGSDTDRAVDDRVSRRARDMRLDRCRALVGDVLEDL